MRLSVALLAVLSFGLSACANMSPGLRPNGWARPASGNGQQVSDRAQSPPVRVARTAERSETDTHVSHGLPNSERTLSEPPSSVSSSGLMIPVVGIEPDDLSDSFHSPRSGGRTHNSIDISAPTGTPLVAIVTGTITRKHWNALGGRTLYLTSANGRYDYYYAHLDSYADGIEIGTDVRQGDVIGTVGSTGNARGPHLHFQVLDKRGSGRGTPVNPYNLLRRADLAEAR